MAFTRMAFIPADGLKNTATYPTQPANETEARANFQAPLDQIKDRINALMVELEKATATSGAELIGSKTINGVAGATVYSQLADLKAQIDGVSQGAVADGTISTVKLANNAVTAAKIADLGVTLAKLATDVSDALNKAKNPVGITMPFFGIIAPEHWLICDGQAVSRATYSELFALIGTTYGVGDGSTTFNVPNLKGKTVFGYNAAESEFNTMGKTGGEKTHQLSINEMPLHTHIQNAHNHLQDGHRHSVEYSGGGNLGLNNGANGYQIKDTSWDNTGDGSLQTNVATPGIYNTTATNQNTGGSQAHNTLPPFMALNWIIMAK